MRRDFFNSAQNKKTRGPEWWIARAWAVAMTHLRIALLPGSYRRNVRRHYLNVVGMPAHVITLFKKQGKSPISLLPCVRFIPPLRIRGGRRGYDGNTPTNLSFNKGNITHPRTRA